MSERILEIDYTNHRGEQRVRKILPVGQMFFGSNQWHHEAQWLINAIDLEDPQEPTKSFALKGINGANADKRIGDLLNANNALLERARDAEDKFAAAQETIAKLSAMIDKLTNAQATAGNAPALTISVDPAPAAPEAVVSQEPAPSAPAADASQSTNASSAASQEPAPVAQPAPEVAPAPAPQSETTAASSQPDPAAAAPAADPAAPATTDTAQTQAPVADAPVAEAQPS